LTLPNSSNLRKVYCQNNKLTSITITEPNNITLFDISNNSISVLDVSNFINLLELNISDNQINDIDLSSSTNIHLADLRNNDLINLNIRNGIDSYRTTLIEGNSSLQTLCVDDFEFNNFEELIEYLSYDVCTIITTCN